MNTEKLKSLVGTKFLFDKNIIKYHDLIQLFEDEEFNIKFATKPISNNLEVHSLYIKPDYEVTYLPMSEKADEYYKNAGYSCVNYRETTLEEVLDVLGYKAPDKEEIPEKPKKSKKSKFVTLVNSIGDVFTFRKNKIHMFIYKNNRLEIRCRKNSYLFTVDDEKYNEVKEMLES